MKISILYNLHIQVFLYALFVLIANVYSFSRYGHYKNIPGISNNILFSNKLVIWDCDGVLVDSEALLKQGEVEALKNAGFKDISIDDCVRLFSGVSIDKAESNFLDEFKQPLPKDFFKKQIDGSMDLFRRRLIPLMKNTVISCHQQSIEMCVASGSPRTRVELCIDIAGISSCLPSNKIFTREQVKDGKPSPDLFLYAASNMGYDIKDCIVIEDAISGILAARAANMEVITFLGGGHTKTKGYREAIRKLETKEFETEHEILDEILKFINK